MSGNQSTRLHGRCVFNLPQGSAVWEHCIVCIMTGKAITCAVLWGCCIITSETIVHALGWGCRIIAHEAIIQEVSPVRLSHHHL